MMFFTFYDIYRYFSPLQRDYGEPKTPPPPAWRHLLQRSSPFPVFGSPRLFQDDMPFCFPWTARVLSLSLIGEFGAELSILSILMRPHLDRDPRPYQCNPRLLVSRFLGGFFPPPCGGPERPTLIVPQRRFQRTNKVCRSEGLVPLGAPP